MDAQGEGRQLAEALDRFSEKADALIGARPSNWNQLHVTGMGSFWNGIGIGIALGVAVACTGWVAYALGNMQDDQRQDDAFIQATYQAVPGLREQFDRIRQEQSNVQRSNHHRSPAASPAAESGNATVQPSAAPTAD